MKFSVSDPKEDASWGEYALDLKPLNIALRVVAAYGAGNLSLQS